MRCPHHPPLSLVPAGCRQWKVVDKLLHVGICTRQSGRRGGVIGQAWQASRPTAGCPMASMGAGGSTHANSNRPTHLVQQALPQVSLCARHGQPPLLARCLEVLPFKEALGWHRWGAKLRLPSDAMQQQGRHDRPHVVVKCQCPVRGALCLPSLARPRSHRWAAPRLNTQWRAGQAGRHGLAVECHVHAPLQSHLPNWRCWPGSNTFRTHPCEG